MVAMGPSAKGRWARGLLVVALLAVAGCDGGKPEKPLYQGVTLEDGVAYATARRWKDHGLEWLVPGAGRIGLQKAVPAAAGLGTAPAVTIMIHGYHAPDTSVASYFRGLVRQVRDAGNHADPIVVFDWPSTARHWVELSADERIAFAEISGARKPDLSWEIGSYNGDRDNARHAGADGLIALLAALRADKPDRRINLVAHSMGCYLVFEAITRHPKELAGIAKVFWLAPDVESKKLADPGFIAGLGAIGRLHVYLSRHDGVLAGLSRMLHWTSMLGADGPGAARTLPANVTVHDMTNGLGETDVHSKHLEAGSVTAVSVMTELKAPD